MANAFDQTTETTSYRNLSAVKGAAILARVQSNPEISTNNQTYVGNLIDRAAAFIIEYCQLERYPEEIKGYAKSGSSATADLSGIDSNSFYISVDGSGWQEIIPTLANCTTGAATAAEIQTQIRAETDLAGFDEVTVAWDADNSIYTITSGRYGESSAINLYFEEDYKHVMQAMKLTQYYGGTEFIGGVADLELDDALVMLTESMYVKMGVEGLSAGGTLGKVSFTFSEIDPLIRRMLGRRRRLWKW